jgi:hypothetical protein
MYKGSDYLIRKVVINSKTTYDIENEYLDYASFGEQLHGLQTTYNADSDEYKKIMELCSEIVKNIKEIDLLLYKKSGE